MFSSVIKTVASFCSMFLTSEKSASKKQPRLFPTNLYCTGNTSLLIIHYFILVVDTFQVDSVKIFGNKFLTQSQNFSLFKCFCQYIIPAACLQNSNIIGFLVGPDLIGNLHTLANECEQFIVY